MFVISNVFLGLVVFLSILLALAIQIAVAIFGASRQPDGKQPPKPLTFRISNIPNKIHKAGFEKSLTKEDFEALLNDIQNCLTKKADPSANLPAQLPYSFAPSAHSAASFVATATLHYPPAPSQLESVFQDKIGGNAAQLRVEHDFFGLTPLTAPEDPVVE